MRGRVLSLLETGQSINRAVNKVILNNIFLWGQNIPCFCQTLPKCPPLPRWFQSLESGEDTQRMSGYLPMHYGRVAILHNHTMPPCWSKSVMVFQKGWSTVLFWPFWLAEAGKQRKKEKAILGVFTSKYSYKCDDTSHLLHVIMLSLLCSEHLFISRPISAKNATALCILFCYSYGG